MACRATWLVLHARTALCILDYAFVNVQLRHNRSFYVWGCFAFLVTCGIREKYDDVAVCVWPLVSTWHNYRVLPKLITWVIHVCICMFIQFQKKKHSRFGWDFQKSHGRAYMHLRHRAYSRQIREPVFENTTDNRRRQEAEFWRYLAHCLQTACAQDVSNESSEFSIFRWRS